MPDKRHDKSSVMQCKLEVLPVMDAMYIISGKWRIPITIALMQGNKRFGEIQKEVSKITAKVLSHELKEMELNGFVNRKIYTEDSLRIQYELTDYSMSVKPVILSLRDFGIEHRKKIQEERGRKSLETK
ncbi:transcriptional regulator, HxlR family [Flavobacterium sp. CF108]|uniref:winged helix-turn-helix transcriptional regulator n=1 Tax=Flavobacterium sp. CF108 TaxID=1882758 RepID=UPI00090FA589|nr:helix-turn-helix domain-containing protein [Flavobacterium sp. CF108]SHH92150.1 transcriptional regulator, HxlR family [Flavobacterium sp. CF108]